MKIFVLIQKTNKIFVCEIIIFQLNFEGYIIWKTYRDVKINFLATVKKLPKSLDLSARPETSSITIILSNLLFYPKMLSLSDLFSFFLWKSLITILNSITFCGYKNSAETLKQDLILCPLSFENIIFVTHRIF